MNKVWNAFGAIAFIAVLIVASSFGQIGEKIASWFLFGLSHEQLVAQTATEISKKLPMMIDRETRMDSVTAGPSGNQLTYNYTLVNYSAHDISAAWLISLEEQVTQVTCSQQDRNLLKKNVALEFKYRSSDDQLIKAFTIRPKSCFYDVYNKKYKFIK